MHVIRDIEEFKHVIKHPNPDQIYALIPVDYEVLSNKPEEILNMVSDCLVYGDVEITDGKNTLVKYNPSFDVSIIARGFALDSPIFLRTNKPLHAKGTELNYVILELLQQIVGTHIAEPIFRWKQNFYTDQASETNIV